MRLGEYLRGKRRETKTKINKIREFTGWSKSYIMDIETSRTIPSLKNTLLYLASTGSLDVKTIFNSINLQAKEKGKFSLSYKEERSDLMFLLMGLWELDLNRTEINELKILMGSIIEDHEDQIK